ncbi:MAG TPA: molybdopterin cofactor-binding domain-containing protein [Bacteroidota bacterium]|nr:molybdopterin cofactor-binding domain-containing protein [Bacteroidota bacterium]
MRDDQFWKADSSNDVTDFAVNRRDFMKIAGGGIIFLFTIDDLEALAQQRSGLNLATDFNAYLRIGADGRVTCYSGKIEMGQGVYTSLAQELADELDVSPDSVEMVMGDTDLCPWDMGTFGSMSTRFFGQALRTAAAEARNVLIEMASEKLKIDAANLTVSNGVISDKKDPKKKATYGELSEGKRIERHIGLKKLKAPSEFKVIGTSALRRDAELKVTGKAMYAGDIRLPGMLYAKILRPPAHGAKLISADLSEAKKVDGVQVVKDGDFIAVIHKFPDVAEAALGKIEAKFSPFEDHLDDKNIFEHFLKVADEGKVIAKTGDLPAGEKESSATFDQTYYNDYVAHSPIEPHTATASMEDGKLTIWASTQTPFPAKDEVARELGLEPKNVRIITPFLGGGFGGKSRNLQVVEAARLAKLTGKPVQVAWTRKEEFFYDSFRPAAVVKIRSGVSGTGAMSFWDYKVYFAGERGAVAPYNIRHHLTTAYDAGRRGGPGVHPFATGPWRAPGNNTNTFARESQIDIMAAKAGIDPLAFRLQNLTDKKLINVLNVAADKFGWSPAKGPSGRGYGIACGTDAGASVASIAEVKVNKSTGEVRVVRVVCAQDMGLAINPEGAKIQMEGCITMGMGYALTEQIHFKDGKILDTNFDSYELPRFSWLPKIETFLIEDKEADPQGGGEPAIITMGGALANAIFDACGARLFSLPMTAERVKEALKS